ncbi:Uma2 family endonuclease [Aetokthonos hydrillicola Thurmond2011]|jgi:Uma2 family endonuclease|uniref:Uma2 family endonuclease n=1 Tax=Aetokthonos hydrillicola Thurmond2011 TaxID=2712845 RepID=A0AAP5II08_9CYAN|nr:Uma2 family endonuclease [Aetokthonos hydrillicola]MBO3459683.1 Uma2 family endonuclease [Aetokthonos hydrillicola CCALA 1050]MBW4589047.1 Uma2 family endonuclease [Aetokthonos hydrillicola CCALA 1050]MDR9900120.1 Uma2 family endonuclease [Aetokthonos hydrillicola Thurmond2011]
MTTFFPQPQSQEVFYPSSDGEPLAETSVHADAIIYTVVALRSYLEGRSAIVLADQFLYYAQGFPKLRVAPDVMIIFDVNSEPRDNYKIWEEGKVPVVIFEMTSSGTKDQDTGFKKTLYEQLGVQEYWLFDPKGEWIREQLRGYRLHREEYEQITDRRSEPLQLRLEIEGQLIAFYREDTGEKLLAPGELVQRLQQEILVRQQAEKRAQQAEERAQQAELQVEILKEKLKALGVDPDTINKLP